MSSVHLLSTANRVNLTDNISRQTKSIKGSSVHTPWTLLLLSDANNKNIQNNVTRQSAAESEDGLMRGNDQRRSDEDVGEEHLHANLSSSVDSVDSASISSNWRCANLSSAYPIWHTATELVAKSNDNNRNSSNSLDKLLSVSKKVAVDFERESATKESIRERAGDCISPLTAESSSSQLTEHAHERPSVAVNATGHSPASFSHMHDDSLSVSAVIDAIASQSSALSSEQSVAVTAARTTPAGRTQLSEQHLDSNSYYRYSSRDNDPNVLLSRYPSLRLPPPPPEFADDFNEGEYI